MLHIVDDEEIIRDSLTWLAQSRAIAAVAYASGDEFLQAMARAANLTPLVNASCSMCACRP